MSYELKIRCQQQEKSLKILYQLVNLTGEDAFVACVPQDAAGQRYPQQAYVALSEDQSAVNLTLGDSDLPLDRDVEFAVGSFYRKVEAEGSVKGELNFEIPLLEWNAYWLKEQPAIGELPINIHQFFFSLTCIKASDVEYETDHGESLFSVYGQEQIITKEFATGSGLPVFAKAGPFPRTKPQEVRSS